MYEKNLNFKFAGISSWQKNLSAGAASFSKSTSVESPFLSEIQQTRARINAQNHLLQFNRGTSAGQTSDTLGISGKGLSLDEYKDYIYSKISLISIDPSQTYRNFSVQITNEGFEAMKNDPDYEDYVLECIRFMFEFKYSEPQGGNCILHFGASKEETRADIWGAKDSAYEIETKETFWQRRTRIHKENLEFSQELYLERLENQKGFDKFGNRIPIEEDLLTADFWFSALG